MASGLHRGFLFLNWLRFFVERLRSNRSLMYDDLKSSPLHDTEAFTLRPSAEFLRSLLRTLIRFCSYHFMIRTFLDIFLLQNAGHGIRFVDFYIRRDAGQIRYRRVSSVHLVIYH